MPHTPKNPHAVELGRLGGAATRGLSTPQKRRASRANGKLGGRPKGSKDKKPRKRSS
jgi:hypothetical protein